VQLTFGGEISRILVWRMIVCLDGEVFRSNFDKSWFIAYPVAFKELFGSPPVLPASGRPWARAGFCFTSLSFCRSPLTWQSFMGLCPKHKLWTVAGCLSWCAVHTLYYPGFKPWTLRSRTFDALPGLAGRLVCKVYGTLKGE